MSSPSSIAAACCALVALAGALPGQRRDAPAPLSRPAIDASGVDAVASGVAVDGPLVARSLATSSGLSYLDGALVGGGPRYHAEFGEDEVVFYPAMPTAERLFPMRLRVVGYGRGEGARAPGTAVRHADADVVFYRRPGFVETYEVRPEGIEQSFVFSQLPEGTGDLVVRVAVDTDLELSPARGALGELSFLHGDHGGVHVGEVVGIDARGARCSGALQFDDGALEMSLPADFLATAALPLVLDPLIWAVSNTNSSGSWDDSDLDVAYDLTNNLYVATWVRQFSATSFALRAQRIADDLALVGGFFAVSSLGANFSRPRIANVNAEDAFLVVYSYGGDIYGRAVRATQSLASVGAEVTIMDNADTLDSPDVGGEATTVDDEAVVVFRDSTQGRTLARQVNVDASVSPPSCAPISTVRILSTLSAGTLSEPPRISNSGGSTGIYCVVWSNASGVVASLVDRDVSGTYVSEFTVSNVGLPGRPAVDGDGSTWVVAWHTTLIGGFTELDIRACSLSYSPSSQVTMSTIVDIASGPGFQEDPAVVWTGDSALILYEREPSVFSSDRDLLFKPVDLYDAEPWWAAPGSLLVQSAGGAQTLPQAVSKAAGGSSEDEVLLVWSTRDLTTNEHTGWAARVEARDGSSVGVGGGCGGGTTHAGVARNGNANFRVHLRGPFGAPNFLVVSPSRMDLPCGACTLVPDLFEGFALVNANYNNGFASFTIPLPGYPAIVGTSFYHQAARLNPVGAPSTGCALFGYHLSDAVRTTIQ